MFLIIKQILIFILGWWWVLVPIAIFFIFKNLWLVYIRQKYISSLSWVLLEVRIPKEIAKTPKAMEQIFTALHGVYLPPGFIEKYFKGKIIDWFSFEIVGVNGEIHFYIRTLVQYRNLVEAQIYAQYPEAEIIELADYVENVPQDIPNKNYDIWGCEFALAKPDAYPIRTYMYFEAEKEEKRIDPLASLMEVLSSLKDGEQIWIQFLIQPTGDDWKRVGDELVAKLIGKKKVIEKGIFEEVISFFREMMDIVVYGKPPEVLTPEEKKELSTLAQFLSAGEREVVEAIEKNISKLGFNTMIKFLYIARIDVFSRTNISSVVGAFKQFNTLNLNGFKLNILTMPIARYFLKKKRIFLKKRRLFLFYKMRLWMSKFFVFNTEELATVYHFPATIVRAPLLPRIEAKKGEPPSTLPIIK